MAKARKADDLLADLDSLGSEDQSTPTPSTQAKPKPAPKQATAKAEEDESSFGELEKMLAAKPASTSRPTTPRVSSSTTSATGKAYTPASTGSARTSDEIRDAQSAESHAPTSVPVASVVESAPVQPAASGGGWWGSMFSAATAAVKQAETLAKEISGNEEAQKWAESVRGYSAGLQSLSTSTSILPLTHQLTRTYVQAQTSDRRLYPPSHP
jgi:hypothetical protein